jgi:choline-sulfatase
LYAYDKNPRPSRAWTGHPPAYASLNCVKAARILIVCWLASASLAAGQAPKKANPPDVFLITIDTLRADHVHCYGYENIQTPALDGLAKDGVRFEQAFTPSPITNTSHTSILTGLLPSSHGVTDFAVPLAPSHPTLAELLKKTGYHTAAFIGAVILDSKTLAPGLDRGFDFYDNFPERAPTKSRWGRVERRGTEVVQHAETWMSAHPAGSHFLWIHLYDPHDPYEPPPPYSETYKDRLYDGEIAYADSALASFVGYLKKIGRYNNALIVVVGDHGEGLGEHHEDTHGIFLYDSTTHVPLIVKLPAQRDPDQVVKAQVRTTDILPTVVDWLGIPLPERLDGASLKPFFDGARKDSVEQRDRTAFGETDYPLRFGWAPLRSVRAEGFKFIEAPRPELYDLHADPGELANHYQQYDLTVQKFRGMLAEVKAKDSAQGSARAASQSSEAQNSSDVLQALGYQGQSGAVSANAGISQLPDPKDKIEEQNLLHAAMIASDDDRTDQARQALEKVLQLDPKSPTALRQLGELELHAGEYVRAAEHLKLARQVRPEDSTAAFEEGQAREKSGDFAGARDALEASLKLTPGQFPARLLLGQVYLGLKDPKNAEDQFEAALLLQPESAEAQRGLTRAQACKSPRLEP